MSETISIRTPTPVPDKTNHPGCGPQIRVRSHWLPEQKRFTVANSTADIILTLRRNAVKPGASHLILYALTNAFNIR